MFGLLSVAMLWGAWVVFKLHTYVSGLLSTSVDFDPSSCTRPFTLTICDAAVATATGGVLPVVIVTVENELLSIPSLTTNPAMYEPALSTKNVGVGDRRLERKAV